MTGGPNSSSASRFPPQGAELLLHLDMGPRVEDFRSCSACRLRSGAADNCPPAVKRPRAGRASFRLTPLLERPALEHGRDFPDPQPADRDHPDVATTEPLLGAIDDTA